MVEITRLNAVLAPKNYRSRYSMGAAFPRSIFRALVNQERGAERSKRHETLAIAGSQGCLA